MGKGKSYSFFFDTRAKVLTLLAFAAAILVLLLPLVFHRLRVPTMQVDYGNVIAICSLFLTILIGVSSLLPNLRSIANTARSTHYSQLDTMYHQILGMALEKPWLRNPGAGRGEGQALQYEIYAFIVWNFLETVRDRCADDVQLRETWGPIVAAEHEIHRDWFFRETTPYRQKASPKFCLGFADFIWRKWPESETSSGNSARRDGAWIREAWDYRTLPDMENDPTVSDFLGTA